MPGCRRASTFQAAPAVALVLRALDDEPLAGKRVVDFGCGSGEVGLWMATEGAEVYLLDFSREVVDAA